MDGAEDMDYLGHFASSDELVESIMEKNFSSVRNQILDSPPVSEFDDLSESVSFIEKDDENVQIRYPSPLQTDNSLSPISQVDSSELLLLPHQPEKDPESEESFLFALFIVEFSPRPPILLLRRNLRTRRSPASFRTLRTSFDL